MKIGLTVLTKVDDWKLAVEAEELGYDSVWFPDSQMIWSDCYATMALAAQATSRIRLGLIVQPLSTSQEISIVSGTHSESIPCAPQTTQGSPLIHHRTYASSRPIRSVALASNTNGR